MRSSSSQPAENKKNKKNVPTWALVCVFAAIVLACAAVLVLGGGGAAGTAVITVDGEETARVDLNGVAEPYELEVCGGCFALVEPGGISMCRADCPDKLCVGRGVLSDGFTPIICLPNRVVIRIERDAEPEYDAVS